MLLEEILREGLQTCAQLTGTDQMLPFMLFTHAHSQLFAAPELGFSGCIAEAGSVLRTAIESCAHGYKLHRNPKLSEIWVKRFDGDAERKAYDSEFWHNKEKKLYQGTPELPHLYVWWKDLSADSSHASLRDMSRRTQITADAAGLEWMVHYVETDAKVLGTSLYKLLHIADLVERVQFRVFEGRLQFDLNLEQKRILFKKYKEQVRCELIAQFGLKASWTA